MSEGSELANIVLDHSNQDAINRGDGKYYPRTSAVTRCVRDMTFHRYGEPWSDQPEASWGTQFRFDVGHDTEDRMVKAMEDAGISIVCQQMTVEATTPMGLKVLGHIDGIAYQRGILSVASGMCWTLRVLGHGCILVSTMSIQVSQSLTTSSKYLCMQRVP